MMRRVLGMPDYKFAVMGIRSQCVGGAACGLCAGDNRAGAQFVVANIDLSALVRPADVIVGQDTKRGAVEIVVLAAFERP